MDMYIQYRIRKSIASPLVQNERMIEGRVSRISSLLNVVGCICSVPMHVCCQYPPFFISVIKQSM